MQHLGGNPSSFGSSDNNTTAQSPFFGSLDGHDHSAAAHGHQQQQVGFGDAAGWHHEQRHGSAMDPGRGTSARKLPRPPSMECVASLENVKKKREGHHGAASVGDDSLRWTFNSTIADESETPRAFHSSTFSSVLDNEFLQN